MRVRDPQKSKRPLRIAAEILRELPDILRSVVDLPGGDIVSITEVEVSDDLSFAKIFFSLYSQDAGKDAAKVADLLNSRKGAVRHEIAQRIIMRQHPDLRFIHDPTPARAARIEELLKQVREQSGEGGDKS
jgi:ribosome-binding factor A